MSTCWVLGAGCWVLGAGCWVLGACCPVLCSPSDLSAIPETGVNHYSSHKGGGAHRGHRPARGPQRAESESVRPVQPLGELSRCITLCLLPASVFSSVKQMIRVSVGRIQRDGAWKVPSFLPLSSFQAIPIPLCLNTALTCGRTWRT